MSEDKKIEDLPTKSPTAAEEARNQADEYGSVFAPRKLTLDDGTVIHVPPHPNLRMFDDEAQADYERLEFELESYDRHPDTPIPEQKVYDKNNNLVTTLEPSVQRGALMVPYRKTDPETKVAALLNPPYIVQVVKIALGDDEYAKLRAGKVDGKQGSARDVWRIWNEQGHKLADRQSDDSKSAGGSVDVAPVPEADSK